MTPHATPSDRASALYRLLAAPGTPRTLEIRVVETPPSAAGPAADATTCWFIDPAAAPDAEPPFARRSFERLLLHRTLDELAGSRRDGGPAFDAGTFLTRLAGLLVPGGVMAGLVHNSESLRRAVGHRATSAAHYTLHDLHRSLAAAGLEDQRVFTVLPSGDDSMRLIDTDAGVSRAMFRHELAGARGRFLPYVARRIAVELGLHQRFMSPAFFFWARARC